MDTEVVAGWLSGEDLDSARERLPIVYVEAVPVRVDERGEVSEVGLLLRVRPDGSISHSLVSGRVWYGELLRDALLRHLEKDLGPRALPRLPAALVPVTVSAPVCVIAPLPLNQSAEEFRSSVLVCTASEMVDRLKLYEELGIDDFIMNPNLGHSQGESLEIGRAHV